MAETIQLRIQVQGNNQAEIVAGTLAMWRGFVGNSEAELPWQVEYEVTEVKGGSGDGPQFTADVIISAVGTKD